MEPVRGGAARVRRLAQLRASCRRRRPSWRQWRDRRVETAPRALLEDARGPELLAEGGDAVRRREGRRSDAALRLELLPGQSPRLRIPRRSPRLLLLLVGGECSGVIFLGLPVRKLCQLLGCHLWLSGGWRRAVRLHAQCTHAGLPTAAHGGCNYSYVGT